MKLENKSDIKVFILYLLKHADEPLEFNMVNDLVLQDEFVNYFDFAFCFSELLEAGQIYEFGEEGKEKLYVISESGLEILEGYESTLLPIIRERALKSAVRLIEFKRTGKRYTREIVECPGGYTLKLGVVDKERIRMTIELFVSEEDIAKEWHDGFKNRFDIVYRGVHALLSGDVDFIFKE